MAGLFGDTFDGYATADILQKWDAMTGATIASNGRNSTNALNLSNFSTKFVRKTVTPSGTTGVAGAAVYIGTLPDFIATLFAVYDSAGTVQLTLAVNPTTGVLTVCRGAALGTTVATSSVGLSAAAYHYVEFKWTIHNSTGAVEVRINNTTVATASGIDTQNSALTNWTTFQVGASIFDATGADIRIDDLYLLDGSGSDNNTFLGPVRGVRTLPDGAGNSTDFTPSAGSNFQNVDDASQDGDSTYNSETTPGDHDTYTFGALGVTGVVKMVQINMVVRSDGGGAETIASMLRIGGTDYQGTTQGVSTSYLDKRQVYDISPATSVPFTLSELDGAEVGQKLVS